MIGLKSLSETGVRGRSFVAEIGVKEIVEGDHVLGHVVGPFEDLWSNIG